LKHRQQNVLLLLASYFFYGCWDYRFLSLIFVSTIVDYAAGLAIPSARNRGRETLARLALIMSLVTNLGLLGVFKYFDFFSWGAARLLTTLGFSVSRPVLEIALPVGISFYTFQTLSYTIDIYRGRIEPTRNLLDFALFVAFFPQLVAGPIERASRLLPQVQKPRYVDREMFEQGMYLILMGLLRKVVIADGAGVIADLSFGDPSGRSSLQVMLALPLYSVQIYNDFGGYSSIARGSALLLGFRLVRNFRQPYFSLNIREFWQRWHISLSTWIRDYLYIPLGGSRCGQSRAYLNLMTAMFLCGLWHGAHWTFVFWGVLHGAYLVAYGIWQQLRERWMPAAESGTVSLPGRILSALLTYFVVLSSWLVFRVNNLGDMLAFVRRILAFDMRCFADLIPFGFIMGLCLLLDVPQAVTGDEFCFMKLRRLPRAALTAACILLVLFFGGEGNVPFIYFQF